MPIRPPTEQSTGSDAASHRLWFHCPPIPEIDVGRRTVNVTLLIPVTSGNRLAPLVLPSA